MIGLQRFAGGLATQLFRRAAYSSSTARTGLALANNGNGSTESGELEQDAINKKPKGRLVAAAFESLKAEENPAVFDAKETKSTGVSSNIDERIINAKTVNGLLAITEVNGAVSRKHALKIVSILSDWTTMNRIKLAEFENDSRFLRLCRTLGRTVAKNGTNAAESGVSNKKNISGFRTDDLNTVLGVAGDDEAAKLIASISLPQMVKVMSTLALRKRRSTPLLRSLAFNVSSSTETLDLKQAADVLYAMATLNFQDSVLSAKVCADIQKALPNNQDRSAVVGSILTSLGILRYRDLDIMETLTQWTLQHSDVCRPQDVSALFHTSAMLNFKSANIEELRQKLVNSVVKQDFAKPNEWLNHVWALSILGLIEHTHLDSVLSAEFVLNLQACKTGLTPTLKMKLLNLHSYAQLLTADYKGALLSADSVVFDVPIAHAKSKQMLLTSVLDALYNLLPSKKHVQSLVDTRMGFLIDVLVLFDDKRNPLPFDKPHANAIKIALMVVDFHDICHGTHRSASGITTLSYELLEKSGYTVIPIPYNELNNSDKLLKRVQYLESKFKAAISDKK